MLDIRTMTCRAKFRKMPEFFSQQWCSHSSSFGQFIQNMFCTLNSNTIKYSLGGVVLRSKGHWTWIILKMFFHSVSVSKGDGASLFIDTSLKCPEGLNVPFCHILLVVCLDAYGICWIMYIYNKNKHQPKVSVILFEAWKELSCTVYYQQSHSVSGDQLLLICIQLCLRKQRWLFSVIL